MRASTHFLLCLLAITVFLAQRTEAASTPGRPARKTKTQRLPLVSPKFQKDKAAQKTGNKGGALAAKKQKDVFCDRFRQACITSAMDGQTDWGNYTIVFDCKKPKGKSNLQYTFGCRMNGKDFTSKAIRKVSKSGATNIKDGVTVAVTVSSTSTIIIPTVQTSVVPTTVETLTATSVSTELVVTTASDAKNAQLGTETIPVTTYDIVGGTYPNLRRDEADEGQLDDLCPSYFKACAKECKRVSSTVRFQRCDAIPNSLTKYALSCICKNGKRHTQHALAKIGLEDVVPVSTSTVTVTNTATATSAAPTTTITTAPVTAQETTVTTTTTYSATTTSTTIHAVAPTGYIRALKKADDTESSHGRYLVTTDSSTLYGLGAKSASLSFLPSRDPATGWLKFVDVASNQVFSAEIGYNGNNLTPDTNAYAWVSGQSDTYAAPGTAGGQGRMSSRPYENWIVSSMKTPTSGKATDPVELVAGYVNEDGSQFLPSWVTNRYVFLTGNMTLFNQYNPFPMEELRMFFSAT